MKLSYIVDMDTTGKTVKHILKGQLQLSERLVKRLKYSGKILRNSLPVWVNEIVEPGDSIEALIDFTDEECETVSPQDIPLNIIYEDECMIVVDKQPGIVVHPTCGHYDSTIANGIMYYLGLSGIKKKIRPVSRLDRDTSGIIIFAKNEFVQESLVRQMNSKTFLKEYIGIVHGMVQERNGTINLPIGRKPGSIVSRHVTETGAPSVTHFEVLDYLKDATLMKFHLETGRTHQIRVHCQAVNHPLVGDGLYPYLDEGSSNSVSSLDASLGRQALHSCRVSFLHPLTRETMNIHSQIPADMCHVLEILRK